MAGLYCDPHGRMDCEACELVRSMEAGQQPSPASRAATDEREVVEVDTLVERPDLGEGVVTLVTAGTPIPTGLGSYARRPALPKTKSSRARRVPNGDRS